MDGFLKETPEEFLNKLLEVFLDKSSEELQKEPSEDFLEVSQENLLVETKRNLPKRKTFKHSDLTPHCKRVTLKFNPSLLEPTYPHLTKWQSKVIMLSWYLPTCM